MLIDKKQAAAILLENDDYLILSHANPDGDTLGCAYGLCGILQKLGKRAKTLCADETASRMSYLEDTVEKQEFEHKTVVSVDVADAKLLGSLEERYGSQVLLAIDHHESRSEFARYTYVEAQSAAACELIYLVAQEMGVELDGKIASCIYTGIATDTGCFRFSNTTPRTHMIAARLMEYDFPYAEINYTLFDLKTRGRIQLEQEIISGMEFYGDGKIAVVTLAEELIKRHEGRVDTEDFNGLSGLPRQIEGVAIGATVKQKKETVFKISLRTSAAVNAAEICSKFGGGGHAAAAGCTIEGTLDEVMEKLIPVLEGAVAGL